MGRENLFVNKTELEFRRKGKKVVKLMC